ncbi:hypothetical protein EBT31_13595 [bacterium]|jgi:transcription initiation factor TFIIIB Brf1 subunit/transcription initiation factor TFIIB|nr:hypothetical protein [bacterium]
MPKKIEMFVSGTRLGILIIIILKKMQQCCEEWSPETEVIDGSSGDRICTRCGRVLEGHMLYDGAAFADLHRVGEAVEPYVDDDEMVGTTLSGIKGVRRAMLSEASEVRHVRRKACLVVSRLGRELRLSECTLAWARELMRDSMDIDVVRAEERIRVVAAACLYFACKLDKVDRGEHEVADALGVHRRDLQKCCNRLRTALVNKTYAPTLLQGIRPTALLPRMLQRVLCLSTLKETVPYNEVRRDVEKLADAIRDEAALDGKKPQSVCAAMIAVTIERRGVPLPPMSRFAQACGLSAGALLGALDEVRSLGVEKKIFLYPQRKC